MQIGVPKETWPGEARCAISPQTAKKLVKAGWQVIVEAGVGEESGFLDAEYQDAGATINADHDSVIGSSDVILRVRKPSLDEVGQFKKGAVHVSFLDPFNEKELVNKLAEAGVDFLLAATLPAAPSAAEGTTYGKPTAPIATPVPAAMSCQRPISLISGP